ncbi:MAG: replication initiator [Marmoricola sp.]
MGIRQRLGAAPPLADADLLASAGRDSAAARTHDCARPVRLRGSTQLVDLATGETRVLYSSGQELDGFSWLPCGNRRAAACEPCSRRYKADAWQLITAGLGGGKGIPATVAEHPCTFATFTAPSFGPVHGMRQRGPCRARRDKPLCPHGRPMWCSRQHGPDDLELGDPLCADCYDYTAHVVWQWHAPELWRRTTIALQRDLARRCGLTVQEFRAACTIAYSKVTEFQARGVVHLHVPIRLDGPEGPDGAPPDLPLTTVDLEAAIHNTAARVRVSSAPLAEGRVYLLRWGDQVDCRTITDTADRETRSRFAVVHPEQVGSYLAKYLTKATEDFGLPATVRSAAHARLAGATDHAVRIIATAEHLAEAGGDYAMLRAHLGTLGYRGHPITKSRAYSVTFGQLRRARRHWRRDPVPDIVDVRELIYDDADIPDGFQLVSSWEFAGQGYLDLDQAAAAVRSATGSRIRSRARERSTAQSNTHERQGR